MPCGDARSPGKSCLWGETVSFELSDGNRKIFSFQIALRTVELDPPRESAWPPVLIESLADNVGNKVNALVQRGAPRDFLDIRQLVTNGIVSVEKCWDWWSRKNPGVGVRQAKARHCGTSRHSSRGGRSIASPTSTNELLPGGRGNGFDGSCSRSRPTRRPRCNGNHVRRSQRLSGPRQPALELREAGDRADYVHRVCAAWDFGIVPEVLTFRLFRAWRDIFDRYPLPHSPAYHAFRD